MRTINYLKRAILSVITSVCFTTLYAEDFRFPFAEEDVAMWKKFMQQPSAIEGKCNLEVLGIDVNRVGFDWDDPNTWAREDGKVFHNKPTTDFVTTVWGVSFDSRDPYYGGTARVGWTRRAYKEGTQEVFEVGKSVEEKWIPYTPGLENLSGRFELTTLAPVVNCCDTKIETVRLIMNNETTDCYLQFSRNFNLTQIDLSDSKGKIRQMPSYRCNLSTLDAFVLNNMRPEELGEDGKYDNGVDYRLFDWVTNIDECHFRMSTMPLIPGGRLYNGYRNQKPFVPESYQLGADGETWEFKAGGFINLSSENVVRDQPTTFVWKDLDGNEVTPDKAVQGRFQFKESFIGRELVCEMTNSFFDGWICKTQPVKIVAEYTTTAVDMVKSDNNLNIFPNPAIDKITIDGAKAFSVKVFTLEGKEIMNENVVDNIFDISRLSTGYYLLDIKSDQGTFIKKIIKK